MFTINNRYRLVSVVGEGSYAQIWYAHDAVNEQNVTVKVYKNTLPTELTGFIRRNNSILRDVCHPHILPIHDIGFHEECLYVIMPFCSFGSIKKLRGKLTELTIWNLIRDITSGLEFIHRCGILHMDIKPDNILLDSNGHYVICDFDQCAIKGKTAYEKFMPTAMAYMAPERYLSSGNFDTYSDIWSLGATIYEIATGNLPFHGLGGQVQLADSTFSIDCAISSAHLSYLINACLNPLPVKRPTAAEIMLLANDILSGKTITSLYSVEHSGRIGKKTLFGFLRKNENLFFNHYNDVQLYTFRTSRIAKSIDNGLYGVVDNNGNIIVDFFYDEIHDFRESGWPGPGPAELSFIGAFFRQRDDVGYLIIREDGRVNEYRRCTYDKFKWLSTLT